MVIGRARGVLISVAALALSTLTTAGYASAGLQPGSERVATNVSSFSSVAPMAMADEQAQDGSGSFAACVRGERSGRLVLLLDESGSLQTADPDAVRVDASTHLLRSWAQQVEGSDIDLQIQVMGFSATAVPSTDWVPVTSTDELIEHVETYRDRNVGEQTDYLMGLDAARSAVSDAGSGCRAVVWFSDGRLDVLSTYVDQDNTTRLKPYLDEQVDGRVATTAAHEEICRDGGAADQLRSSGINLLAIGLASELTDATDFDLMKAATTETTCGHLEPSGSFYLADDLEALLFAFANVARAEEPIVQEGGICQGEVADECLHQFVLDDSISGVSLMITSEEEALDLIVIPPEGQPRTVPAADEVSSSQVGGAQAEVRRLSARTLSIELASGGDWAGVWAVGLVDPASNSAAARSQSSLHLTPDAQPIWIPGETLRSGENGELRIGLQRADGTPIDVDSLLGDVNLDADFIGPDLQTRSLGQGLGATELGEPIDLDLGDVGPGSAQLRLTLNLTTADFEDPQGGSVPGTVLAPMVVTQRTQIEPPMGLPVVGDEISFGRVLDGDQAAAELSVTGPGCVWIEPSSAELRAAPRGTEPVVLASPADSAASCLRVEDGQTAALPVQLNTAGPSMGGLNGVVTVQLTPLEDVTRQVPTTRPFSADLDKTPNEVVFWATVVALVVGAVLIPLALLYGIKRWASRIPGRGLLGEAFALELSGDAITGGIPDRLEPHHFRQPIDVPRKGATRLSIGPAQLRTATGWSPLGVGEVHMTVPGMVGVSDTSKRPTKKGAARLPLAVHDHWAIFRDPGGDRGVLVYLTSLERPRGEMEDDLARLTGELSADLRTIGSSGISPAGARDDGAASSGVVAGGAAGASAGTGDDDPLFAFDTETGGPQTRDVPVPGNASAPAGSAAAEPTSDGDRTSTFGDDFDFDFGSDPNP